MDSELSASAGAANASFGMLVIGALIRLGVTHFVVSPGSRSTPLALAAAKLGDKQTTVILDERSAAFYALGRIKASSRPVAVISTSGSAGAHYYPAVIEAREAGLPLIVLTADRPPELRHCHAGQTIDQVKLFGTYPLFQAELPIPEPDKRLMRQTREICRRAVESALGLPSGPVHLNCPYREPFFANEEGADEWGTTILDSLIPVSPKIPRINTVPHLPARTVILAGPRPGMDSEIEMEALLNLSVRFGYPILADGSNPLRYRDSGDAAIVTHYDRISRVDSLWDHLCPEACLLWGEPPTSKILRQRLAESDLPGFLIGTGKPGINPIHGNIEWLGCSTADFLSAVNADSGSFAMDWMEADEQMQRSLDTAMSGSHDLFEGDIHRLLGEVLEQGSNIYFASSLAIRDADWFMPRRERPLNPFSQRGANGIDGLLSLARGVAAEAEGLTYLVTGDLAFLHDGNGLLGCGRDEKGLFVILVNNSGGGIFNFLPIAREEVDFERMFAAPQNVDIAQLVAAHGGTHRLAKSLDDLRESISQWNGAGLVVVELPVDREVSFVLHQKFLKL